MESGVNFEALQIKKQTLKQRRRLEDAIATSLDYFNQVVKSFYKAAIPSLFEIVGHVGLIFFKRCNELIEAVHFTLFNPLNPTVKLKV